MAETTTSDPARGWRLIRRRHAPNNNKAPASIRCQHEKLQPNIVARRAGRRQRFMRALSWEECPERWAQAFPDLCVARTGSMAVLIKCRQSVEE